jgi:hypothetical protein
LDKIDNQVAAFPNRPDWDGYLTLQEANDWYRNGNGQPLFVDASKMNLSPVRLSDFNNVGSRISKNFLSMNGNIETGLVYGTIKLTLLNYSVPNVTLGRSSDGFLDTYDFNMDGRLLRDAATLIGSLNAGTGSPFDIYVYGAGIIKK